LQTTNFIIQFNHLMQKLLFLISILLLCQHGIAQFIESAPIDNSEYGALSKGTEIEVSGKVRLTNDKGLQLNRVETNVICMNTSLAIIAKKSTIHSVSINDSEASFSAKISIPTSDEFPLNIITENGELDREATPIYFYAIQNRVWYGDEAEVVANGDYFANGWFVMVDENGKGANGNTGTDESINNKPEPSTNHSEVFSSNNPKHNEDLGKLRRASSYNVSGTIALTNPLGYKLNRVETNILCYGTTQSIIAQKSTIHNITVTGDSASYNTTLQIPFGANWPLSIFDEENNLYKVDGEPYFTYCIQTRAWYGDVAENLTNGDYYTNSYFALVDANGNGITIDKTNEPGIEIPNIFIPESVFSTSIPAQNNSLGHLMKGSVYHASGSVKLANSSGVPLHSVETNIYYFDKNWGLIDVKTTKSQLDTIDNQASFHTTVIIPTDSNWPYSELDDQGNLIRNESGQPAAIYCIQNRAWYGDEANQLENGDFYQNGWFSLIPAKDNSYGPSVEYGGYNPSTDINDSIKLSYNITPTQYGFIKSVPENNEELGFLRQGSTYEVSGEVSYTNEKNIKLHQVETRITCMTPDLKEIIAEDVTIHTLIQDTSYHMVRVDTVNSLFIQNVNTRFKGIVTIPNDERWPLTIVDKQGLVIKDDNGNPVNGICFIQNRAWYGDEPENIANGDFYVNGWFYLVDSNGNANTLEEPLSDVKGNIEPEINVFPNPVQGDEIEVSTKGFGKEFNISILTLSGLTIKQDNGSSTTETINISSLNPGIYMVMIHNNEESKTQRIIIK